MFSTLIFEYHDLFSVFIIAVDIISAIEFDKTGDHLATGDRGGRVVLFERTDTKEVGIFTVQFRRFIKNWRLFSLIMSLLLRCVALAYW